MDRPNYLNPRNLSKFKRFELIAHSVVEGFISGLHKSPYKGFAIEFAEHRLYSPGDDLKHLDWKVLGKLDRYYIKQYEEDTALSSYFILDTSGSMGYKSGDFSKFDYGRFICAVMGYLLLMQSDSIGLITFDSEINTHLPPRTTKQHYKHFIDHLLECRTTRETGMGDVLHRLANMLKRRALIVIISDFFDDIKDITRALNHFAHKRHEIIVFQTLDRNEAEFPFTDPTRFESLENESFNLVDPLRLRKEYLKQFQAHQNEIRKTCHKLRIDYVPMFTDKPFERLIAKYLSGRLRR